MFKFELEENINEGQPREHDISKIMIKYWKDYNLTKLDIDYDMKNTTYFIFQIIPNQFILWVQDSLMKI